MKNKNALVLINDEIYLTQEEFEKYGMVKSKKKAEKNNKKKKKDNSSKDIKVKNITMTDTKKQKHSNSGDDKDFKIEELIDDNSHYKVVVNIKIEEIRKINIHGFTIRKGFKFSPFTNLVLLEGIPVIETKDMSNMFRGLKYFIGDISLWNVSKVTNMEAMFGDTTFGESYFKGNISRWDVSNVTNMRSMFASSKFNGDISEWDVKNVKDMSWMFAHAEFDRPIDWWNVTKCKNFSYLFYRSKFSHDIMDWRLRKRANINGLFDYSLIPFGKQYIIRQGTGCCLFG
jgi:surface protein